MSRVRWEYHTAVVRTLSLLSTTVQNSDRSQLDAAGDDGWELVTVLRDDDGQGFRAFFKRPRPTEGRRSG